MRLPDGVEQDVDEEVVVLGRDIAAGQEHLKQSDSLDKGTPETNTSDSLCKRNNVLLRLPFIFFQ